MNQTNRQFVNVLVAMAICVTLLTLVWVFAITPALNPVWTEKGTITSIARGSDNWISDWHFTVNTATHGIVSPVISQCGFELVGNSIYVTLLSGGKYAQTDNAGNVITRC